MDRKEFELQPLTSNSDKEFHQWAGDSLLKYPPLLNAYTLLRECWDNYHKEK